MFISQYEGGQLIKSNYKPEYPVGEGGGNSFMVSVTSVCNILYGHALTSKNVKLIEVVNGVKCQINYLFYQYAGQMSI